MIDRGNKAKTIKFLTENNISDWEKIKSKIHGNDTEVLVYLIADFFKEKYTESVVQEKINEAIQSLNDVIKQQSEKMAIEIDQFRNKEHELHLQISDLKNKLAESAQNTTKTIEVKTPIELSEYQFIADVPEPLFKMALKARKSFIEQHKTDLENYPTQLTNKAIEYYLKHKYDING